MLCKKTFIAGAWTFIVLLLWLFNHSSAIASIEISAELQGFPYQLELQENSELIDKLKGRVTRSLQGEHFNGKIKNIEDSWVRLSKINNDWQGVISMGGILYVINPSDNQPSAIQGPGKPLRVTPLSHKSFHATCGDSGHKIMSQIQGRQSPIPPAMGKVLFPQLCASTVDGVCILAEVEFAFDTAFVNKFPGSALHQATSLINIAEGFFEQDLNVHFDAITIEFLDSELFTTSTDAEELIEDIADKKFFNQIPFEKNRQALFHLVTGRNFDDSTAGIAYIDTLCNIFGFNSGTSQLLFNDIPLTAMIVAHELAHGFGADHDGEGGASSCGPGFLMDSSINPFVTGFSSCSISQIRHSIESLATPENCFNFPADISITADENNPDRVSVNESVTTRYTVRADTAYLPISQLEVEGGISFEGRFTSATLDGIDCSIIDEGRSYSCLHNDPANLIELEVNAVGVDQPFRNDMEQRHRVNIDQQQDLKEFNTTNNETVSSLAVIGVPVRLGYFSNGDRTNQSQSFVRVINDNAFQASVTISGIDDAGDPAPLGEVSFTLESNQAKQISITDLEQGNVAKGLTGQFGQGEGEWHLSVTSSQEVQVMNLVRTTDGLLENLSRGAPRNEQSSHKVYFVNPARNSQKQTILRIINNDLSGGTISITGIDDNGTPAPGGDLSLVIGPQETIQLSTVDLENGNSNKGLSGQLGVGSGKWQLTLTSPLNIEVMSLVRNPNGLLTNLSETVPESENGEHHIYFANPASNTIRQSFFRIVNDSDQAGTVTISGIDDSGLPAPQGDVSFTLGPNQARQLTIVDLEQGNPSKGLSGQLGDGQGKWRLTITASVDIKVMSLLRTWDGLLSNLSQTVPQRNGQRIIYFANPASNTVKKTLLRIINKRANRRTVILSATADDGLIAPQGNITVTLGPNEAKQFTTADLENGNTALGVNGHLGDGTGKWVIKLSSDEIEVMSLIRSPNGFLSNMSNTAN